MGYRGKVEEQAVARDLRAEGWTVPDIADKLSVARSSVSLWVRDIPLPVGHTRRIRADRPNRLRDAKNAEIARLLAEGRDRIGTLSEREFLVAGAALYAGEGSKTDGKLCFTNTNPALVLFFYEWLRRHFETSEDKFRLRLYLHEGLDLDAARDFWSTVTRIPIARFGKPYRAADNPPRTGQRAISTGCATVVYYSASLHREVMGLVEALISCATSFRGSSIGRASDC